MNTVLLAFAQLSRVPTVDPEQGAAWKLIADALDSGHPAAGEAAARYVAAQPPLTCLAALWS